MKKLILLPLLLSFAFCQALTRLKIIKQGLCFVKAQGHFEKDLSSPKDFDGEILISQNNMVSIYTWFYSTDKPWEQFLLVDKIEGPYDPYITTWKGIGIISGGIEYTKKPQAPNVLMCMESKASEIVIYVGGAKAVLATYYICKRN